MEHHHHQKLAPNAKKATEDKERTLKVPATDPVDEEGNLADLGGRQQQPQLQREEREHQAPNISEMKPVTREAYGGGMYGNEKGSTREPGRPRASATQSADGPEEPVGRPRHPPPPSTGDRDLDITGMSYIQ